MGTRVSYPKELKLKAVKMKLEGVPTKVILASLTIRNATQVETWTRWYKNGEMHRFEQPVGKQYTYGKGPKDLSEIGLVKNENLFLKQQIDILKKYAELERRWLNKLCMTNKFRYGYRKITVILRQEININHKAVQRIMQKFG